MSFGVKAAIMPIHSWLPAAMAAPTPVSALLHAVAVVKAGVFGFARAIGFIIGPALFQESGAAGILGGLAAATILIASPWSLLNSPISKSGSDEMERSLSSSEESSKCRNIDWEADSFFPNGCECWVI